MTATTTTDAIPLNKLAAWSGNVRKTGADTGLAELSASIAAHGLLQSLVVRKDKKGKYAVVAGRRRLLALASLAEAGTIAADAPIPCHIIDRDANATEISLAENTVREQMHPADEFDAFLALIESGTHPADIAARFGVTETVVQQRLKLARVSPVIIAAYRNDEITLAHVMAFAVTDDHAAQERVWNELGEWQLEEPDNIRDTLTEGEVTAKNRHVKFITLKAYEKAGGAVRRDLFAQDEDGVFIQDVVLLESLVAKKLEKAAAAVRKEGWKWVEVRGSFDYSEWSKCERRYPQAPPLAAAEQAELDALTKEYDELNEAEGDDESGEENPRLDEITKRMEEIEGGEKSWQPDTLAIAGAVVSIGHDGKAEIHYGYVKPEDAPKKKPKEKTVTNPEDGTVTTVEEETFTMSAALTESLTAHRTAALGAALTDNPGVALAAVVHSLALQAFYNGHSRDTCLQITGEETTLRDVEGSTACAVRERAHQQWGECLPGNPHDLWKWCLEQPQDILLDLLACCAACTVNAVQSKSDSADDERLLHADRLAAALRLDMAQWFKPTAANYFSRIGKPGILAALQEVKGATAPAWAKMKKSELAVFAERELADTGWLPPLLKRPA
jgi:ParB family chromosome partitioning protein